MTTSATTSAVELAKRMASNPETAGALNKTKETTNIVDNSGKRVFAHSIPMSTFVFSSGKVINFRGGLYGTEDEKEIAELLAASKNNGLLSEADENGQALYSAEEKLRQQAANILG